VGVSSCFLPVSTAATSVSYSSSYNINCMQLMILRRNVRDLSNDSLSVTLQNVYKAIVFDHLFNRPIFF